RYVNGREPFAKGVEPFHKDVEPLPFEEVFNDVGVVYSAEHSYEDLSLGIDSPDLGITQLDSVPKLQISTTAHLNEMGKALGFQEGDVLLKINDEEFPAIGSPEFGAFI